MELRDILTGSTSGDNKGNINHPLVKCEFIIIHISLSLMLIIERDIWGRFSPEGGWACFWVIYILQIMDFRRRFLRQYISKVIILSAVAIIPLLLHDQQIINIRNIFGWVKVVIAYVTPRDIIIMLYGIGALLAARRLYSLDVLWICQKLPLRVANIMIPLMITYFVTRRFLTQSLKNMFESARFKAQILRDHGWRQRFSSYIMALVTQTIQLFLHIVDLTEVILYEREILGERWQNPIPVKYTWEDYIAGVGGAAIFLVMVVTLFFRTLLPV